MQFLLFSLFAALIVAVDQYTKYLTVANIALYADVPFIPGLLQLTYVRNTGAAFSSFEGQQWLFALIFIVFTGMIFYEYFKKPMGFTTFERWCIAAIYGGGLGNMIDRVRLGYVVDMIETTFMRFPVFNVADCFITCGCILMLIHLVLWNKPFWKDDSNAAGSADTAEEEKSEDAQAAEEAPSDEPENPSEAPEETEEAGAEAPEQKEETHHDADC